MANGSKPKKWDTAGLAFLGAASGLLIGGAHEVGEAYFHSPEHQESFAYMLTEIIVATALGAVLFASVSCARNLAVAHNGGKKPPQWDPTALAFIGAGVGMLLVIVHEAYNIFSGYFDDVDPFVHIMSELAIMAAAGAMLFGAIAQIRNWLSRR